MYQDWQCEIPYLRSLNLQSYLEDIWDRYYFGQLTKPQFVAIVKAKHLVRGIDRLNLEKLSREDAIEALEAFLASKGLTDDGAILKLVATMKAEMERDLQAIEEEIRDNGG